MSLNVSYLLDGYTFQDVLDAQGTPGRGYPKPDWVEYAKVRSGGMIKSRNEQVYTYSLEESELIVYVGESSGLWFCAPLTVTGAPSE